MIIILIIAMGLFAAVSFGTIETAIAFLIEIAAKLVGIILTPVNLLIESLLPDLSNGITAVNNMLDLAATYLSWIVNATLLSTAALTLITGYYIFAFTTTFSVWAVKNLFKWKRSILN